MSRLLLAIATAEAADLVTTYIGIANGGVEGNAAMVSVVAVPLMALAVKAGLVAGAMLYAYTCRKARVPWMATLGLSALLLVASLPPIGNVRLMLGLS